MKLTLSEKINNDFILSLHKILAEATGINWKIDIVKGKVGQTLAQLENRKSEEDKRNIMEFPLVKAILSEFKGAKIETLTRKITENSDNDDSSFASANTENDLIDEED